MLTSLANLYMIVLSTFTGFVLLAKWTIRECFQTKQQYMYIVGKDRIYVYKF